MHNEKYYADLFRLREADAADTQRGASASPSLSTLDGDGFPPIAEDEETRAMQLTGFRANDPFLASANARFEARLEARHSSSGARKLEQFGARNALAQSLREVQAARAEARAAQQAEELFYLKTGGEVLSGEEIVRERCTADRLKRSAQEARKALRQTERRQAELAESIKRAGFDHGDVQTLICTPGTAHVAPTPLCLDVSLHEEQWSEAMDDTSLSSSAKRRHARHDSPPTRQRKRSSSPPPRRSTPANELRHHVRMVSMGSTEAQHVSSKIRSKATWDLAGDGLEQPQGQRPPSPSSGEELGKERRKGWQGNQTVAGQLLELSAQAYRERRRPSFGEDGRLKELKSEPDVTLSQSGNLGSYRTIEADPSGIWRGQDVDADGGMGHLALGAKLEHNLTRSWKSLAARRAAVRQSPPAHPWFSPYRAAKAEKAIATGAADGTILSLLKG